MTILPNPWVFALNSGNTDMVSFYSIYFEMQNHCVERIWVEINSRVNYPLKSCLVMMQESGDIDLDCDHQRFCISWFTIRVATVGTALAVEAWNNHPIPGKLTI